MSAADVRAAARIWYRGALMSKRKPARSKAATADLDPAALQLQKAHERLRKLASRALLKRRRRKSGQ